MGMYTELIFGAELKKDTPKEVIEILQYMVEGYLQKKEQPKIPEHNFFKTSRWDCLFLSTSYHFGVKVEEHSTHVGCMHYNPSGKTPEEQYCKCKNIKKKDD